MFTVRFVTVSILVFNMQYLQALQVMTSQLVILVVFIFNLRACIKFKFFKNKKTKIYRLIQEGSFVLIMLCINIFYFDSEFGYIKDSGLKYFLVFLFATLVCMNVLMEIFSAFKMLLSSLCKKKKSSLPQNAKKSQIASMINANGGPISTNRLELLESDRNISQMSNRSLQTELEKFESHK